MGWVGGFTPVKLSQTLALCFCDGSKQLFGPCEGFIYHQCHVFLCLLDCFVLLFKKEDRL